MNSSLLRRFGALALLAAAAPDVARAYPTVAIGAPSDVNVGSFGKYAFGTYATFVQTFMTPGPSATYLQSFAFTLDDDFGQGADLRWTARVYQFDPVSLKLVGGSLYTSPVQTGSPTFAPGSDTFTFTGPYGYLNLNLASGTPYAFVLTALGDDAATFANLTDGASNEIAASSTDAYAGGAAYRSSATGSIADLTVDNAFESVDGAPDLAFDARFTASSVPEPTTFVLFGGGLALVGVVARRRRS